MSNTPNQEDIVEALRGYVEDLYRHQGVQDQNQQPVAHQPRLVPTTNISRAIPHGSPIDLNNLFPFWALPPNRRQQNNLTTDTSNMPAYGSNLTTGSIMPSLFPNLSKTNRGVIPHGSPVNLNQMMTPTMPHSNILQDIIRNIRGY